MSGGGLMEYVPIAYLHNGNGWHGNHGNHHDMYTGQSIYINTFTFIFLFWR